MRFCGCGRGAWTRPPGHDECVSVGAVFLDRVCVCHLTGAGVVGDAKVQYRVLGVFPGSRQGPFTVLQALGEGQRESLAAEVLRTGRLEFPRPMKHHGFRCDVS